MKERHQADTHPTTHETHEIVEDTSETPNDPSEKEHHTNTEAVATLVENLSPSLKREIKWITDLISEHIDNPFTAMGENGKSLYEMISRLAERKSYKTNLWDSVIQIIKKHPDYKSVLRKQEEQKQADIPHLKQKAERIAQANTGDSRSRDSKIETNSRTLENLQRLSHSLNAAHKFFTHEWNHRSGQQVAADIRSLMQGLRSLEEDYRNLNRDRPDSEKSHMLRERTNRLVSNGKRLTDRLYSAGQTLRGRFSRESGKMRNLASAIDDHLDQLQRSLRSSNA
jgi:hypothetical protein